MSYVARSLGPGEKILYVASISWVSYSWAVVVAIIGVVVMFFWLHAGLIILALGLIWFIVVRVHNSTIELAVTNHKVVAKRGFIARETIEQRLEKIDAIDVDQTVLGRILDYGNITVHGTGVDSTPIRMIADPLTFRRQVEQAIEAKIGPAQQQAAKEGN
ncbi:MAG: PH domain-containing protein [Methylobacteriaceae bacterium]|nr:PH domain-containing protein [Methylobacteriaceae bacterium]MBV9221121.1 PH domain-containing protein [Methylobacteriaceae bacterium]MBV9245483.1 PH domain-containing protein [Methylobacteriaceae bacterium]MBV9634560.1 PH domain-containing protein [Methylobacteriaceae bacterium]